MPRYHCRSCMDTGRVINPPRMYGDVETRGTCPDCAFARPAENPWIAQARWDQAAADAAVDAACEAGDFGPLTDHTQHSAAGWRNDDDD